QLNSSVPLELESLLQQMLAMDSERRPESAQHVLEKLRTIDQQRMTGTFTRAPKSSTPQPMAESMRLTQAARALYTQRKLPEALSASDLALQADNTNALDYQEVGMSQALVSQHPNALAYFEKRLELDKAFVAARNGKGT